MAQISDSAPTSEGPGRGKYYAILVLAVLVGWFGVNAAILALGRTPLWRDDALPLYVNFLAWEGQALRDAFASLLAGNGFAFPLYTYSLGYGADTIVTMMGCLNDPLNLIAVFFPPELAEVPYVLLIPVRLVLAAITFSWFCFERGHDRSATLVGSLCFVFGGYSVYWGILRHANFLNWAITLPLVLLGADRIFEGKKPTTFIWGIALQFLVSVYFTYMSCLVLLVYCLVKYFFAPRERSVGDLLKLVGRFVLFLLIAFCIGAVFAYPSIIALLSQSRATDGAPVSALFSLSYYAAIGVQSVGGMVTMRGMYEGAVSLVLVLVFVLCGRHFAKDARRPWLIGLVLCWVGILVPFVGHAMNGFGYVSDRWMLAYNFVCAYIACATVPVLGELDRTDLKRVALGTAFVGCWAACYAVYAAVASGVKKAIWPLLMIVLLVVVFLLVARFAKRASSGSPESKQGLQKTATILACMALVGVSLNASLFCSSFGSSYAGAFPSFGAAGHDLTDKSTAAVIDQLDDDTQFRHSYVRLYNGKKNAALVHGTMGIDFYSSYYNQYVDEYRQELGISDHYRNYSFIGSDSRFALEALAGTKYYVTTKADAWRVPHGYSQLMVDDSDVTGFQAYGGSEALPLAFVTDEVISRDVYDHASMVDKQGVLLQGLVVDERDVAGDYSFAEFESTAVPVAYTIGSQDGLTIEGGIVMTEKDNASLVLSFEGLPESETYVYFDELAFSAHSPAHLAELTGKEVTPKVLVKELVWNAPTTYSVTASVDGHSKGITAATPEASGYGGKSNWIINMGYSEKAMTSFKVTFSTAGTYTFADLGVYCQPVKPVVEMAVKLGARPVEDLQLGVNRIEATASMSGDDSQLAFFSFAYTPGWSATVDGEPAMVVRADTAFMAVEIQGAGTHEIVLSYVTPGLEKGAIASVVGIISLVVVVLVRKRKSHQMA